MATVDHSKTDLFRDRELFQDPDPYYEWARRCEDDPTSMLRGRRELHLEFTPAKGS